MHKIGVVGDYDSICGFSALGLDIYPVDTPDEAYNTVDRIANQNYGIIYITENYAEKMQPVFEKYDEKEIPAIIPIPSVRGGKDFARQRVKRYVEQAVGSDIIFNDNK